MTLRVVLEYDEGIDSWAAYCPEMPGINSCGATQEEAAANFKEAAELSFEPSDFLVPEKSKVLQRVYGRASDALLQFPRLCNYTIAAISVQYFLCTAHILLFFCTSV